MASHSPTEVLVHFSDTWPADAMAVVRDAIVAFEAQTDLAHPPLGAPWVVTAHTLPHLDIYLAQRSGLGNGLQAPSAAGLATAIRKQAAVLSGPPQP